MTMFSRHEVINNLRDEKMKLEDKLEAIKTHWKKQPSPYDEGEHNTWWEEMDEILEAKK